VSSPSASESSSGGTTGGDAYGFINPDVTAKVKDQPLAGAVGSGLTRGVTSTSIKVGCVYTSAFWPNSAGGYAARFDRANAEGGINGRKIDFSGCADDGNSGDTALSNTKRLVEQEQDFAIMEQSTFATPQVSDYLNAQQVPFFGWFPPGFCGTRWGFGFLGCIISSGITSLKYGWATAANLYPVLASGLTFKDTKAALFGTDADSCRSSFSDSQKIIEANGGKVIYNVCNIPITGVTDFTPYVRPVLATHPNVISINVALGGLAQIIAALHAGGYKGVITNPSGYSPGLLQAQPALAKALEGAYSISFTPPLEQSTPYNTQMLKDFAANKTQPGQGTFFAYDQADMLVQMLTAAGKDLNTKTFDQAVNGGSFVYKANPAGGPPDVPFPVGHFAPADCSAATQVVNGKYVVKGEYKCFPSVQVRG
jgi:ABC-type branched-subunit amino acid transport system substrate-binding protein